MNIISETLQDYIRRWLPSEWTISIESMRNCDRIWMKSETYRKREWLDVHTDGTVSSQLRVWYLNEPNSTDSIRRWVKKLHRNQIEFIKAKQFILEHYQKKKAAESAALGTQPCDP